MLSTILSMLLLQVSPAGDASKLVVGTPETVTVVDRDRIGGEPWRLSWSPDGQQLYLAAMKQGRNQSMELTHHLLDLASRKLQKVDQEPSWASEYWHWKSWKSAPGDPAFAITLDEQRKNVSATARPMGGSLARGAPSSGDPGASIDDVAGQMSTNTLIITLLLNGEILGRWEGEPFVAGLTFGWGPENSRLIAFANQTGRLVLMDKQGQKQQIDSTKDVRLPAWSGDAERLVWVEKQDRKKFRVQVADVSRP